MPPRRGMLIKNVAERPITIKLNNRTIEMVAEEEVIVSAEEVRDPEMREHLQIRTIAIVRPASDEESGTLQSVA